MRAVFTLLLVSSLPAVASAQKVAVPWANKLFGTTWEHDFGKVARDAKPSHTFVMTNIYETTLQITEVKTNCGCSTATVSKKTLKPGEKADLVVTIDGSKVDGPKYARVQVTVGPEFVSTATLFVTVEPLLDIVINPRVLDLGVVTRGSVITKSVSIEKPGKAPWQIIKAVDAGKAPVAVKVSPRPSEKGAAYDLEVTLKADLPPGSFKHDVVLLTNDKIHPTVSFPVMANVQGTLSLTPDWIDITDPIKVGSETKRKFVLRAARPFKVTSVEGLGEGVAIDLPREAAAFHILEVRVRPTRPGVVRREVLLRTDLDGEFVPLLLEARGEK